MNRILKVAIILIALLLAFAFGAQTLNAKENVSEPNQPVYWETYFASQHDVSVKCVKPAHLDGYNDGNTWSAEGDYDFVVLTGGKPSSGQRHAIYYDVQEGQVLRHAYYNISHIIVCNEVTPSTSPIPTNTPTPSVSPTTTPAPTAGTPTPAPVPSNAATPPAESVTTTTLPDTATEGHSILSWIGWFIVGFASGWLFLHALRRYVR